MRGKSEQRLSDILCRMNLDPSTSMKNYFKHWANLNEYNKRRKQTRKYQQKRLHSKNKKFAKTSKQKQHTYKQKQASEQGDNQTQATTTASSTNRRQGTKPVSVYCKTCCCTPNKLLLLFNYSLPVLSVASHTTVQGG